MKTETTLKIRDYYNVHQKWLYNTLPGRDAPTIIHVYKEN